MNLLDNDIFDGEPLKDNIIIIKSPKSKKPRTKDSAAQKKLFEMFSADSFSTNTLVLFNKTCLGHKVPGAKLGNTRAYFIDWHLEQPTRMESVLEGLTSITKAFPKCPLKLQEGNFPPATVEQCCGPHDFRYFEKLTSKIPT